EPGAWRGPEWQAEGVRIVAAGGIDGEEPIVVLKLAGEGYGVEISGVQEIIRMQPITRIPNGPAHIEGVTNLRGKVIPVLDLRKRFGLAVEDLTERGRIVFAELGEHTV